VPTNSSQNVNQSWQEGALNTSQNPVPGFGTQISSNRSSWLADGFDFYSSGINLKKFDPVSNAWVGVPNTNQYGIKNPEGYMLYLRGDRTVIGSSPANVVAPTVLRTKGLLYSGNLPPIAVLPGKSQSIGNPFAAPIDLRKISKTGVKDFFYAWDPALNGLYGAGGYQTFSPDGNGNYTVTPGGGSYGPAGSINNYIESGKAFFVQGTVAGGTVNFTEHAKYDPADADNQGSGQRKLQLSLLTVNADSSSFISDGLLVNFSDSYSNAVNDEDAVKFANTGENISTLTQAKSLVVENRLMPVNKDTIYLKVSNLKVQKYQLAISCAQLDANGRTGFLIDNYKHTSTALQLSGNTRINFTVENVAASSAANRFMIVFDRYGVLPVKFTNVKAYAVDKTVDVTWQTGEEINIDHYDVERSQNGTGFTKISSLPARGTTVAAYLVNDAHPFTDINYYRIRAVENSGATTYSNIVKVAMPASTPAIEVSPNPVVEGKTSLRLTNIPNGNCTIKLFSNMGQEVFSSSVKHSGNGRYPLEIGKALPAGIYELTITDAHGNRYTKEVIVE
jgi:hypothetical protein